MILLVPSYVTFQLPAKDILRGLWHGNFRHTLNPYRHWVSGDLLKKIISENWMFMRTTIVGFGNRWEYSMSFLRKELLLYIIDLIYDDQFKWNELAAHPVSKERFHLLKDGIFYPPFRHWVCGDQLKNIISKNGRILRTGAICFGNKWEYYYMYFFE